MPESFLKKDPSGLPTLETFDVSPRDIAIENIKQIIKSNPAPVPTTPQAQSIEEESNSLNEDAVRELVQSKAVSDAAGASALFATKEALNSVTNRDIRSAAEITTNVSNASASGAIADAGSVERKQHLYERYIQLKNKIDLASKTDPKSSRFYKIKMKQTQMTAEELKKEIDLSASDVSSAASTSQNSNGNAQSLAMGSGVINTDTENSPSRSYTTEDSPVDTEESQRNRQAAAPPKSATAPAVVSNPSGAQGATGPAGKRAPASVNGNVAQAPAPALTAAPAPAPTTSPWHSKATGVLKSPATLAVGGLGIAVLAGSQLLKKSDKKDDKKPEKKEAEKTKARKAIAEEIKEDALLSKRGERDL